MKKEPFKLTVNEHYQFELFPEAAQQLDLVPNGEEHFHLLNNGLAYQIELLDADYPNSTYIFRIDGTKFTVKISDYYERLVQQLGLTIGGSQKLNIVKAPMPGLVIDVLVTPGQAVHKGEALVILEAMKMENIIKATGEGVVKSVHAKKGEAVEKGFVLFEFE